MAQDLQTLSKFTPERVKEWKDRNALAILRADQKGLISPFFDPVDILVGPVAAARSVGTKALAGVPLDVLASLAGSAVEDSDIPGLPLMASVATGFAGGKMVDALQDEMTREALRRRALTPLMNERGSVKLAGGGTRAYHGSKYGVKDWQDEKGYIGAGFFNDQKDVASRYARGETPTADGGGWKTNENPFGGDFANDVREVRLDIKKPITDETTLEDVLGDAEEALRYREDFGVITNPMPFSASMEDGSDLSIIAHLAARSKPFKDYLKKKGFDGYSYWDEETGGITHIPFSKEQIKEVKR